MGRTTDYRGGTRDCPYEAPINTPTVEYFGILAFKAIVRLLNKIITKDKTQNEVLIALGVKCVKTEQDGNKNLYFPVIGETRRILVCGKPGYN